MEHGIASQGRQTLDQKIQKEKFRSKPGPRQYGRMRHDLRLSAGRTADGGSRREFSDPGSLRSQGKWNMDHGRGADTSRIRILNTTALIVYYIWLQEGDHIELGNRIYAATLGARFDTTGSEEEPTNSEEDARYLQDLPGYSSGHIHWALGTASVDRHGMPTSLQKLNPPSKVGTSTLLDKDILEIILCTQQAEQKWTDTLSMLRRVHSIWNHVARSIYLEFTNDIPGTQTMEEENSWRSAFYRESKKAGDRISSLRAPTDPSTTPSMRNILDVLRTYPATLNIQIEAMKTFQWRISRITKQDNYEMEHFASRLHVITLHAALSRHIIRPNPYAAQDLNSQIQEHTAVTPRFLRTLCLRKNLGQDWILTKQAAFILLMKLRGMYSEHLVKLGANTIETLKTFVQSHLISQGSRWMKRQAYVAWSGVQESLTMNLYDMIIELLRIQSRQDTLHQTEMLQAIADSLGDTTQNEDVTAHGFSILPKLTRGPNSSPLDGVILKVLRARWDSNSLSPKLWTQGYRQRKAMHTAGTFSTPMKLSNSFTSRLR